MGFGFECSILMDKYVVLKRVILNIADMLLIPLDHISYVT